MIKLVTSNLKSILHKAYLIFQIIFPSLRYRKIVKVMNSYDMVAEQDEKFFQRLYMHIIEERMSISLREKKLTILDAGCGQGRIAIPLAQMGHQVVGVDLAKNAVDQAKAYAREAGVEIKIICGDLGAELRKFPNEHFDVVICNEVLYMLDYYEELIERMVLLLKPKGLLILSLRPKLFYVYHSVMNGKFRTAANLVLNESSFVEDGLLNCLTKEEMISLMTLKSLTDIKVNGIGILCGIKGDPQACFALPSALNKEEQNFLYTMELKLSEEYPDSGRYILISGVKAQ